MNRKSDEQDQRVQRVYITELGRETSKKTVELFQKAVKGFLKGCPREELAVYQGVLEKVKEMFECWMRLPAVKRQNRKVRGQHA